MIQLIPDSEETIRARFREMSDAELLRAGQNLRFLCSQKEPDPDFVTQLRLAREEWRRRFKKLPLNDSLDK